MQQESITVRQFRRLDAYEFVRAEAQEQATIHGKTVYVYEDESGIFRYRYTPCGKGEGFITQLEPGKGTCNTQ